MPWPTPMHIVTRAYGASRRCNSSAVVTTSSDGHAWRQVTDTNGNQGWMANEFLSPAAAGQGQFQVANTGGQGANLRQQPDASAARITTIAEGATLSGEQHAWRHVSDRAGNNGWVADEFLVPEG